MSINPKDQCAIHGYEPVPPNYYMICNECWHCFESAEDLENLDVEVRRSIDPERWHATLPASEIRICPVCTHDF